MAKKTVIKDIYVEQAVFSARVVVLGAIVVVLTLVLVGRIVNLQIFDYEHYSTQAKNNRVRLSPVLPARGLIYDRSGIVIAENQPAYNLELVPANVDDLGRTLQQLKPLVNLTEDEITRFHKLRRRTPSFQLVTLKYNLSEEEVARFMVERQRFKGVDVLARLKRNYPQGEEFVHVLGYIGRINDKDRERIDTVDYRGSTHIGKTGIERKYEGLLHGDTGLHHEEINSHGRFIRLLDETPPISGDSLVLTLDLELQKVARQALKGQYAGAVVVVDPRNGDVLAAVSEPAFDPNLFVNGISSKDYKLLTSDPDRPLFDRVTQGQYPPGSTIKPITALGGLEHDLVEPGKKFWAGPYYKLPNHDHRYRDWNKSGHGWVDLDKAIVQSSDVFFYDLSYRLGIDRMYPMFSQFGFGKQTGIDLPGEKPGLMPSREWKRNKYRQHWFPGETIIAGIGQGYMLATPLQLAVSTACIATRGICYKPKILKNRLSAKSAFSLQSEAETYQISLKNEAHWDHIIDAMEHVISKPNGTAHKAFKETPYRVAGKTGTAQVFSLGQEQEYNEEELEFRLRDHGLFVGFAPVENPEIAVAVVVEHGGSGSRSAAPVARKVLDYWLGRDGRFSQN